MLGKNDLVRVRNVKLLEEKVVCLESEHEVSVWGISVLYTDGTTECFSDVCCCSKDINLICEKLTFYEDVCKVHVSNIIEDLMGYLCTIPARKSVISA